MLLIGIHYHSWSKTKNKLIEVDNHIEIVSQIYQTSLNFIKTCHITLCQKQAQIHRNVGTQKTSARCNQIWHILTNIDIFCQKGCEMLRNY